MTALVATPRARALGAAIRAARRRRGMGLRELSRLAEVPSPQLSHWEKGTRLPKVEELAGLLAYLRVVGEEKAWFIDLARNAHEPNWLEHSPPGSFAGLASFVEYERTATVVFSWQPALIPGLFQTAEYAKAILASGGLTTKEVEQRLIVRLSRRGVLDGPEAAHHTVLVGELALRQGIGSDAVMAGELRYLIRSARRENVTVRVVRNGGGYHPGLSGAFDIWEFADLPPIVHVEHYRGSAYLYTEDKVAAYQAAGKRLAELALGEAESSALIRGVVAELEA